MKVGLLLSGDGVKAAALVGALKALVDNGVKIDLICGSGTGALVAALLAVGYDADEMKSLMPKYDKLFSRRKSLTRFLPAQKRLKDKYISSFLWRKVEKILIKDLERAGARKMCHTAIPLLLPTVDILTGKLIYFVSHGANFVSGGCTEFIVNAYLSKAVIAAMTPPQCRDGQRFDRYRLISAQAQTALSAEHLKRLGADSIIAIHTAANHMDCHCNSCERNKNSILEKANYVISLHISEIRLNRLSQSDYYYRAGYDMVNRQIEKIIISTYMKE